MKATAIRSYDYYAFRRSRQRYPNGRERRPFLEKLVDSLLAAAITLAVVVILLVLLI